MDDVLLVEGDGGSEGDEPTLVDAQVMEEGRGLGEVGEYHAEGDIEVEELGRQRVRRGRAVEIELPKDEVLEGRVQELSEEIRLVREGGEDVEGVKRVLWEGGGNRQGGEDLG